jgi:hypothetical protein
LVSVATQAECQQLAEELHEHGEVMQAMESIPDYRDPNRLVALSSLAPKVNAKMLYLLVETNGVN